MALTANRRAVLYGEITATALAWALGRAEVEEIDRINILQATLLAMRRAVEGLALTPDHALIDGNRCPPLSCPVQAARWLPLIAPTRATAWRSTRVIRAGYISRRWNVSG